MPHEKEAAALDSPRPEGATFDEIVFQFMSGSSTLSDKQRLRVMKKSADTLQQLNETLPDDEQYIKAQSRGREAYRKEVLASGHGGRNTSRSRSRAASTARGGRPSLNLQVDSLQQPHSTSVTPRQVFSAGADSAPASPVKVELGTGEERVVLYDYYPEPVRSRNRRPSYRMRRLSQINMQLQEEQNNRSGTSADVSGRTGNNSASARNRSQTDRSGAASPSSPSKRKRGGDPNVSIGESSNVSTTGAPTPRRRRHTICEGSPQKGEQLPDGSASTTAAFNSSGEAIGTNKTPRRRRSQSFSGHTPRGGAASNSLSVSSPLGTSANGTTGGPRARRASFLSKAYLDHSLSVYQASPKMAEDGRTFDPAYKAFPSPGGSSRGNADTSKNSGTATPAAAPQDSAPASPPMLHEAGKEDSLPPVLSLDMTQLSREPSDTDFMDPPLTGRPTTARTEAAYRKQRDQVLQKLQNEIGALERQREERQRQLEEERRTRPRLVENVADYPEIQRTLQLVAQNPSSAFNWTALAEAMSEAQLLPPYCIDVTYTPPPDDSPFATKEAEPETPQGPQTFRMNMEQMLIEALNNDFEMRNAWEGLALLLQPGEKVVIKKPRTRRPVTVTHVDCYIQLLRIEPFFFYGWMGLGCAILEEQQKAEKEAKEVAAAMAAEEGGGSSSPGTPGAVPSTPSKTRRRSGAAGSAASTPGSTRKKRRSSKIRHGPDDGVARTLNTTASSEEEGRGGGASSPSSKAGTTTTSNIPPLSFPVLYGRRPYEAKDCFGRAAQVCVWDGAIWAQLLSCLPNTQSTVEFDPPMEERELVELREQQEMMRTANNISPEYFVKSAGLTPAAAAALYEQLEKLSARLAAGTEMTFCEVAAVALTLSPKSRDLWMYVGTRLKPSPSSSAAGRVTPKMSAARQAVHPARTPASTARRRSVHQSADTNNSNTNNSSGAPGGGHPAAAGVSGAATASANNPSTSAAHPAGTVVTVLGKTYSKEQCLREAEKLFKKQLQEMEDGVKGFSEAATHTMTAYHSLLTAFDVFGRAVHQLAAVCAGQSEPLRARGAEFHKGMTAMRDGSGFVAFDDAIRRGTTAPVAALRERVQTLRRQVDGLSESEHAYTSARAKVDKMERKHNGNGVKLAGNAAYMKERQRRESAGDVYDTKKTEVTSAMQRMREDVARTLDDSLNSYLRSTSTFCAYLQSVMEGFRTDDIRADVAHPSQLSELRDSAARASVSRRQRSSAAANALAAERATATVTRRGRYAAMREV